MLALPGAPHSVLILCWTLAGVCLPYLVYVEMDEVLVLHTERLEHPWWEGGSVTVEPDPWVGLRAPGPLGNLCVATPSSGDQIPCLAGWR